MEVNELMVGDWVNYKSPSSGKIRPIKIKNIYGAEFNCEVEDWNIISGKSISDTEPIELTEDILVNNRFALDKSLAEIGTKVYTRPCPAGDLSVKVFHDGPIRFGFIKLTYVHQLQHLLRLCGINKEIEL